MVSKDFFPKEIEIDKKKIFPVVVIGTMSSGKSSLINALLRKDMLPNSNFPCTAWNYSILDDDQKSKEIICVVDTTGKTKVIEENLTEELARINERDSVTHVFIRSHVKGVLNTDRALLMIDTPGPNDARNALREDILVNTIKKINNGLFLYILNASQKGIKDDEELLRTVKSITVKNSGIRMLFVLNKMDVLDQERESVEEFVTDAGEYLKECGFEQANIIPVSAKAAILFRKVLSGQSLTQLEYSNFTDLYELYKSRDFTMRKYAVTDDLSRQFDEIKYERKKYKIGDLNQAIENTGIGLIEEYIQKAQILSSERLKNTVKVKIK